MDIPEEHKSLVENSSEWNHENVISKTIEPRTEKDTKQNPKEIEPSDTHMSLQNNDFGAEFKAEIEAKLRAELEAEHKAKEQDWITGKHIL